MENIKLSSYATINRTYHHISFMEGTMKNKRRFFRMNAQGMEADISDDIGFCSARVKDMSRFGVCLSDMRRKPSVKGGKFLLIISDQEGHRFKMHAQGRWELERRSDTIFGVEIINAPWAWTELVLARERQKRISGVLPAGC